MKIVIDISEKAYNALTHTEFDANLVVDEMRKAIVNGTPLLEQQSCEDCISREAVMKCFKKWQPYMATRLLDYEQELKELPSVTPTSDAKERDKE